jgi:hypothetical protein
MGSGSAICVCEFLLSLRDEVIGPEIYWSRTNDSEIIRGLEVLLLCLTFLAPRRGSTNCCDFSKTKQNTFIVQITLDYSIKQSASGWRGHAMVRAEPNGDDNVSSRREVRDHVMRTGLRNLLMDAHASATGKAYPDNYVAKSRELAEKKLASLYAGVVRAQSFGGPKAPTDPVATVILRLARKAVISRPEVAAASNADRLATINRLAAEYAKEQDAIAAQG